MSRGKEVTIKKGSGMRRALSKWMWGQDPWHVEYTIDINNRGSRSKEGLDKNKKYVGISWTSAQSLSMHNDALNLPERVFFVLCSKCLFISLFEIINIKWS